MIKESLPLIFVLLWAALMTINAVYSSIHRKYTEENITYLTETVDKQQKLISLLFVMNRLEILPKRPDTTKNSLLVYYNDPWLTYNRESELTYNNLRSMGDYSEIRMDFLD